MNPVIRPATKEDIEEFLGPIDQTVRAWVVEYKGGKVALAGTVRISPFASLAFSNIRETDAPKITVYRTALKLFEKIKTTGSVIIADPNENEPAIAKGAPAFLKSLGFHEIDGVFRWDNFR